MPEECLPESREPRWRVRQPARRRWRRWIERKLAQAEVVAPDGVRYQVRVSRNLPFKATPLGQFDNVMPQHVSLPVLVAANLYARGRTGWSVQILRAETPWRAERVIFTERVGGAADVADVAIALAASIHLGAQPWVDEQSGRTIGSRVKRVMNWD